MADISLTASMRSNLLSLQNTNSLMDRTQDRLSTGKKVNSAIDNPSSYYTARSLNNRAGDLNNLLDSMGQGISTIKAANEGIESITSFVEQAKAIANSARDISVGDVKSSGEYSTTAKQTYTFSVDGDDVSFSSSKTGSALATELKTYLTTAAPTGMGWDAATTVDYNNTTGKITVKKDGDAAKTASFDAYSFKLEVAGKTDPIFVDAGSAANAAAIVTALSSSLTGITLDDGTAVTGLTAEADDDGNIVVKSADSFEVSFSGTAFGMSLDGKVGSADRMSYMAQYNQLLDQITDIAKDSGYKGINLLRQDDLTVVFNEDRSSKLLIEGVDATADGLGLVKVSDWGSNTGLDDDLARVDNAINQLRTISTEFGNNYSILQTRENFTDSLVNVLEEGSDKLTLADMNEESANMLALQTRQQLAINSLSLASQAAQSVLKLFS